MRARNRDLASAGTLSISVSASFMLLASGPAAAQEQSQSASARAMLEEIVVTARRHEENLMDLPLSIVAINAEAMQAQGIYTIDQIENFVPNLAMQHDERVNDTQVFIRGIGGGDGNPANVFGTGLYIDGHYISGLVGAFMSTVDVERVEVMRGPQGTLFGKNTTGGAVNIITAKPGPDFASELVLRAGEFEQQDVRAMVNVPFGDNVYGRLSVSSEQNDGFYYNRFLDYDTGGQDQQSMLAAVRWNAGEHWILDASVNYAEDRDEGRGGNCRAYPNQEAVDALEAFSGEDYTGPVFDDGVGAWGGFGDGAGAVERLGPGTTFDTWEACEESRAMGEYVTAQEKITFSDVDNRGAFLKATWDSGGAVGGLDNINVQVQGSYRDTTHNYAMDRDYHPFPVDGVGNYTATDRGGNRTTRQFETIFTAVASERLQFTTGIHIFEDIGKLGNVDCLTRWRTAYDPTFPGPDGVLGSSPGPDGIQGTPDDELSDDGLINGQFDDTIECQPDGGTMFERLPQTGQTGLNMNSVEARGESWAVYGHVTYALTDLWTLDFGARYTEEDRTLASVEMSVGDTCFFIGPVLCQPSPILMSRQLVLLDGLYVDTSGTFDGTTPMVSATRSIGGDRIDDGIVYFLISEGWLTGAFNEEINTFRIPELTPLIPFDPEEVTNYEIGFKGSILGGRLRIAADVFYMDYQNKQEIINIDNSDGHLGSDPNPELKTNASDVTISGVEIELRTSPWENGFVSFDAGYLNNEYGNYETFTENDEGVVVPIDQSDLIISDRTPDWTVTVSLEHAFTFGNGATLTPLLGVYVQDGYEWLGGVSRDAPESACYQDGYSKWRARVTYEPAGARWQAALFGSNLTDEATLAGCGEGRTGVLDYYLAPPRSYGLEFTARWGNGS